VVATLAVGSVTAWLVGPAAVAGPAIPAQEQEPLTLAAELSPTVVAPGGQLVYSAIDPCPAIEEIGLHFAYGLDGWSSTEGGVDIADGFADFRADGTWTTTVTAPAEPGRYEIVASCLPNEAEWGPSAPIGYYPALDFEVVSEPEGTRAAQPAEAASAVPGDPDYTG
jgi:hypothetical protein